MLDVQEKPSFWGLQVKTEKTSGRIPRWPVH